MRKFIIDTDTASDDAAAIMMAVLSKQIDLLGVTVVAGNVSMEQACLNALMTLEVCDADVPVFAGAKRPLFHERKETISVHGIDGMGDRGIINPTKSPQEDRAVEFILDTVNKYPGEVEIAVLGPATNIALAVLTDRETMRKVKHIWSMGTPGFGPGNATPVSEFNVFIDAEAYSLMLAAGVPVTIVGFDLCLGEIGLDEEELAYLESQGKAGLFLSEATKVLLEFNRQTRGVSMVDLPDAIAMAVALWPDFVLGRVKCLCHCCC
ncbi:MAG: nucleoside hydrolase, partial [Symbiobacteriaceae bacterium]|nr:nucleoside hydrolase [Symbiobacteriaceae bacterium]